MNIKVTQENPACKIEGIKRVRSDIRIDYIMCGADPMIMVRI